MKFILTLVLPVIIGFLPCSLFAQSGSTDEETSTFIEWYSMEKAQELAKTSQKMVFIYAYAAWCTYCKKMEQETFPVKEVRERLETYFYPVRVDIDSDEKLVFNKETFTGSGFARKYRVTATPTMFFIAGDGEIIGAQPGFIPPGIFEKLLSYVGTGAYEEYNFTEFLDKNEDKGRNE